MKFLKFILPVLVIFQIAAFAQGFKKSSVLTFAADNCKTIGKNPLVTVCIESKEEGAQYTKRLGGAFKSAIDDLIVNFNAESRSLNLITCPGTYGDDCDSLCILNVDWKPCCGPGV